MTITTEKMLFDLTEADVVDRGAQLAQLHKVYDEAELAKKQATSAHSKALKDIRKQMQALSSAVREHKEYREVAIRETEDARKFEVVTVRCDTEQEIRRRAMTPEELEKARNPSLFGQEDEDEEDVLNDVN